MDTVKIDDSKITYRNKLFCEQYITHWNRTVAYKSVYKCNSTAAAQVCASKLLAKPVIKEYIITIQQNIEKAANISRLKIVKELIKIAFSDIADMHENWDKLKPLESLTAAQRASICDIATSELDNESSTKIKLHSKAAAIKILVQILGYASPEKLDISVNAKKTMEIRFIDATK